jgi:tetraacyldisaccharide 4'-kinase
MSNLKPLGRNFISTPLSLIFRFVVTLKNFWHNSFPPQKREFPVISVGGISTGGTGKTPLTALIIEELIKADKTPVLLSRGYGRISKEIAIKTPFETATWQDVGDEPLMLKNRFTSLWLIITGDRTAGANQIKGKLPKNSVYIMDDGFQHRKFFRDLDIITVPDTIFEDSLLPAGLMREPIESLSRADIIVVMGENRNSCKSKIEKLFPEKTIYTATTISNEWVNISSGRKTEKLTDPTKLFASIARPNRFFESAKKVANIIEKPIAFPDHHIFTKKDYELLQTTQNVQLGMTEKDSVRINKDFLVKREDLWYLTISTRFDSQILKFNEKILDTIKERD